MVIPNEVAKRATPCESGNSLRDMGNELTIREPLAVLQDPMRYQEATAEAKEFWEKIQAATEHRPDLLEKLVGACLREGLSLQAIHEGAVRSNAITMLSVVQDAREECLAMVGPAA